jgi:probable addiction module antidote protein
MTDETSPASSPLDTSDENMAAFLEAAMADAASDPACVPRALGTIARARNISKLAQEIGMSRAGVHKVIAEDGKPTFATIFKMAQALGLRIVLEKL